MKRMLKCLLGLSLVLGAVYLWFLPPVKRRRKEIYDYGFLPGCPSHDDGTMSTSQIRRCELAIEAYKNDDFRTLIISGGAVKNQYVEAEVMKDYIRQFSSMPIITETQARNTFENFKNVAAITQGASVLILCSSLHARRCSAIGAKFFSHYGVLTYPDWKFKHIGREIISRVIYIKLEIQKLLGLF